MIFDLDSFLNFSIFVLVLYFAFVNSFGSYQVKRDKELSRIPKDSPKYWRIPEGQLMLIAAMGGSFAMYYTMKKIRHKTRHMKFMVWIPIMMILQTLLILFLIWLCRA